MRRCNLVTWIVILSIVNFALGAPAAVQEGLQMSVDVDVGECGTATSQKRYDSLDEWSTTNAADLSEEDRLWETIAENFGFFCRESPGECFGSTESVGSNSPNYAPSSPGSSTGYQPTPPQSPTGGSPLPPLPRPGPSEVRFPGPPGFSANPDTLSSTNHQPTPPQSPTVSSPLPPLPHPGPSADHFPSPPDSPNRFLNDLFKGKFKRRISGSGTLNSAQRHPRSSNIPT